MKTKRSVSTCLSCPPCDRHCCARSDDETVKGVRGFDDIIYSLIVDRIDEKDVEKDVEIPFAGTLVVSEQSRFE